MKFWSRYHDPSYTITPDDYEYVGPGGRHRRKVPGIHAQFVPMPGGAGSRFDSLEAQARFRWDDETREQVEQYLQDHADFGLSLHLLDEPDPERTAEGPAANVCLLMLTDSAGVHVCGAPAAAGERFCPEHKAQLEAQVEPVTDDRGRVPAPSPDPMPAPPPGVELVDVGADQSAID